MSKRDTKVAWQVSKMKPEINSGSDGQSSLTNIKNKINIKLTRLVRFLFQVINAKKFVIVSCLYS